jgi:hypothetical protein
VIASCAYTWRRVLRCAPAVGGVAVVVVVGVVEAGEVVVAAVEEAAAEAVGG